MQVTLTNKIIMKDTDGNELHAHGGHMLNAPDGYIYWYGEDRRDNIYVSCYRSKNFSDWEFRGHIITIDTPVKGTRVRTNTSLKSEKDGKVNLERPKVIYNEKTKKYVLWVHYENGVNYNVAGLSIATSDYPDKDFTYHGCFNPFGYMSRDCTLWQEDNGNAYFISAARNNADLHVYKLADDYMNVSKLTGKLWQGEYREAPAVLKKDGMYYMMSSFCTGWAPNQGKYATCDSMEGEWTSLCNIGDEITYSSQPAFIYEIKGTKKTSYLYVGDKWDAKNYFNSTYVFLPLQFNDDGTMFMEYTDKISVDLETGEISHL